MEGYSRMTLQEFMNSVESKYAVIQTLSYENDSVAKEISTSPRQFTKDGISFTVLSIECRQIPELVAYAEQVGNGVEFELTIGSGKATLLTHSQVLALLPADPIE